MLSLLSLWVTHPFLGVYPLYENTIALWHSCPEYREISRKAEIFNISCKVLSFTELFPNDASASMIFPWNILNSDGAWQS